MRYDLRSILSGERRGWAAGIVRSLLSLAVPFYAAGVAIRSWAFNHRWRRIHISPVPVISIGNLTTGGTGKTPVVAWTVQRLLALGASPGILSRGYGQLDDGSNDEKRVLDQFCPDVPHIQNPDRVAGSMRAREQGCDVLVLDDGFQHRRLARDLDLVLIDALSPWGYRSLLPRGLLREPPAALGRAHLIAITRADQIDTETRETLHAEIRTYTPVPVLEIAFVPTGLVNAAGDRRPLARLQSTTLGACCGIGNPQAFLRTLTALGTPPGPERFRIYPDHHRYTAADQAVLAKWVRENGIETLVVTQKDLVKLPQTHIGRAALWGLEIGVEFLSGGDVMNHHLQQLLHNDQ